MRRRRDGLKAVTSFLGRLVVHGVTTFNHRPSGLRIGGSSIARASSLRRYAITGMACTCSHVRITSMSRSVRVADSPVVPTHDRVVRLQVKVHHLLRLSSRRRLVLHGCDQCHHTAPIMQPLLRKKRVMVLAPRCCTSKYCAAAIPLLLLFATSDFDRMTSSYSGFSRHFDTTPIQRCHPRSCLDGAVQPLPGFSEFESSASPLYKARKVRPLL